MMKLKIEGELEVNVSRSMVHVVEAIKTHSKITHIKLTSCCFKAQKHVVLWLNINLIGFLSMITKCESNIIH